MSTRPGRDDPCPCGSGRKYKACCLEAMRAESLGLHRLRRIEAELIPELFRFSDEVYGKDYFLEAWEEFSLWRPLAEDVEDIPEFATTFPHWFLFRFEFDPHQPRDVTADWPPMPVARAYLERRGDGLDSTKRRFVEALCRRPYSFYRILDVDPGRGLTLRDVFTGAEYDVTDNEASMEARAGGLFYTSVLSIDDTAILIGCAPSLLPPYEELRLLELRDRFEAGVQGGRLDEDHLCDRDIEVRSQYWDAVYGDEELDGLEFGDLDGEPVAFTCLHFELSCSPAEAFEKLRPLALHVGEEDLLARASHGEEGELEMVSLPWLEYCQLGEGGDGAVEARADTARAAAEDRDDLEDEEGDGVGVAYVGYITIDGSELMAEVTSVERADRLRAEIEDRLAGAATFQRSEVEPFEKYLEDLSLWMEEDEDDEEEEGEDQAALGDETVEDVEGSWFDDENDEAWLSEVEDEPSDDSWLEQSEDDWEEVDWGDEDEGRSEVPEAELPASSAPDESDDFDRSDGTDEEEREREERSDAFPTRGASRVFDIDDLFPRGSDSEPHVDASTLTPEMAESFWHHWLDEKIPALRDQTPREAVATRQGRARVEVLLRSYDWAFELEPDMPIAIDVATLRRELRLL